MSDRARDWFRHLLWAEDTLRSGRYAQACFAAQQVAEDQAREAVEFARRIVGIARPVIGGGLSRDAILVRSRRDPLFGFTAEAFLEWLAGRLAGRAREAYLFGSFGTPAFGPESDIDLMLVVDTDLPFIERGGVFDDLRDRVPSLEILVYTPQEFERLVADPSRGFWRSVSNTCRRVM